MEPSSEPSSDPLAPSDDRPGPRRQRRAVVDALPDDRPLRKAVDALAIVPTRDRIYPLARKLYNVLLYFAQQQGHEELIYRAPLRHLVKVVDFNSNNTEVIKNHLRQLVTTKVEWQSPTTGEGARWSVSALIAHCDLVIRGGELIIEWSYAPNIKQQLLEPQRYARLSLVFQAAMRSMASLVLYEICTRYVDNPGRVTARKPWSWWRPVLTGTPDSAVDTYIEYKYFKRDVLKPAIAEVNAVTDLEVSLIEHRAGRSVDEIQFSVHRKEQASLPMPHLLPMDLEAVALAVRQGVPQEQAEHLVAQHGERAVTAGLKSMAARAAIDTMPPVANPGRFLAGILRNSSMQAVTPPSNGKPAKQAGRGLSRASLIERYRSEQRARIAALFAELEQSERDGLIERFRAEVMPRQPAALQRAFEKTGLPNPMVRAEFMRWFAEATWGPGWDQPTDAQLLTLALDGSGSA